MLSLYSFHRPQILEGTVLGYVEFLSGKYVRQNTIKGAVFSMEIHAIKPLVMVCEVRVFRFTGGCFNISIQVEPWY